MFPSLLPKLSEVSVSKAERVLFQDEVEEFSQHVLPLILFGGWRVGGNGLLEGHVDAEGLRDGGVEI